MNVNNCRYHKCDNKCSIDDCPCFNVSGFENWKCPDYQNKEREEE